jgi:hypothetical protein
MKNSFADRKYFCPKPAKSAVGVRLRLGLDNDCDAALPN